MKNQLHAGQGGQIELFFKAIKQNLRIKTFVGTSANAVRIQICTALIAMLLLKLQRGGPDSQAVPPDPLQEAA